MAAGRGGDDRVLVVVGQVTREVMREVMIECASRGMVAGEVPATPPRRQA